MLSNMRPLKIIHASNLTLNPKPPGYFGTPYKISNGLIRNGHSVANFSDRDEARHSSLLRNRKTGVGGANRKLLALATDYQPDVVLFGHADVIRPKTLIALRNSLPDVILAQWNVDPLFCDGNIRRINSKIGLVDWTFVSTAGSSLRSLGQGGTYPVAFLPNPVDSSIERSAAFACARQDLAHDLIYAAGDGDEERHHAGRTITPRGLVERLLGALPGLRGTFPGILGAPVITGAAYERALATTAMTLNLSRRNDVHLYTSDRLAQAVGCGILTFVDRATGYGELFGEDELAFYSTEEELIDRLRAFLDDDAARRRIAESGWRAYRALFDATKVTGYMIGVMLGQIDPAGFKWER